MKIAIDAGHGPNTPGKRCPDDSMREFAFNSAVARYLRDELAKYSEVVTKFVHADDGSRDVPLAERTSTANSWGADIYVSIHANAFGAAWNDANGIETFVSTDKEAREVRLAVAVQKRLIAETGRRDRGVKFADFHVIYRAKMPAILVECGFMTSREEAALLKSDAYRRKCAKAIADGIADVYGLKRKEKEVDDNVEKATVTVNGKRISDGLYDAKAGVVYVPVRAVAEEFGASVAWDGKGKRVEITRK